jgi:polysaccharide export outer membrane protein
MKRVSAFVFSLILLSLLVGCSGNQETRTGNAEATVARDTSTEKMNDVLLRAAMSRSTDPNADYIIGAEDLIEIEVFQTEELHKTVRVSSQGYIGLPLIGRVKAKGLTPGELEKEIIKRLFKYMEDPLVSVYIKEYKAQRIGVMGAVTHPEIYSVTGARNLLDMLSAAGGLTKEAGSICYVLRPLNPEKKESDRAETIIIDLTELLEKGNTALNIAVFGGDVIHIPKGGVVFVDGAVNKPGSFPLQGKTTLVQALAMAEGLRYEADRSGVSIMRDNGAGARDLIAVDYDAIREGRQPDVALKENDIIVVPVSGVKNFLTGFVNTLRGFVSVGKTVY